MPFPDLELIPFFQWLLRTSVQASVLVCLILAVQALLRRKLGARWHYCLWLLLLVRLIMPGAPESSLSVFNLMHFGYHAVEPEVVVLGRAEPAEPVSLSIPAPMPLLPGQLDGEPIPPQRAPFRVQPVPLIWAFGALLVAIYAVGQNIALSSRVARQRQVTDEGVLSLLENCKETMGVRSYLSVVETPRVKSPALLGFIRPRLLLPVGMIETLGRDELRYVFLHELAHLKRRDIAVNWLMAALQLMHWFNPLIWYAFYRMRADREIACDALVLSRTQPGESKSYGRTIVSLLERFSQPRRVPGLAGIVEDKSQIKRRITMIALFKRDSLLRSVVSLVLLAALGCVVLTDARGAPEAGTGDAPSTVFVASEEEQAERDEKMEEMEEKLDTVVSLDFAKGTDIRDILGFLSDYADVNIVLDERVMLPPPGFPTLALDDSVPKVPGAIEPSVPTEMHRVYIKDMPLRNALGAAFEPAGLQYAAQPNFIWLSRPDVLAKEAFPPTESRLTVPSGEREGRENVIGQVESVAARLGTSVSLDFAEGTDIRDVLSFLSDFAQVNIVLDERVMLPPLPPPTAPRTPGTPPVPTSTLEPSARPPVDGIDRTLRSEVRRVYLRNILLGDALAAMLKQWGLDFKALPEYIWVSRPDVLKKETFRAVETRIRPPKEEGDVEATKAKLEEMHEALRKSVSLDFAEDTNLRDVFQFLSDFVGFNIVLDERVILPADGMTAEPVGGIEPTIDGHVRRIYLRAISLGEALIAMCKQIGLDYAVTPEFIWISTPDVLRSESSEQYETRYYTLTDADRADEIMAMLKEAVADIIDPHTGETLSYMDFGPTTNTIIIHNTPSNFEIIEKMLSLSSQKAGEEEISEVSELLDVGVKLYADGYYRDALDRFNRALVIDPQNETAKKYIEECRQYLIPGRVGEDVEVEYPEERAPRGPSPQEVRQAAVEKYLAFGQEHFDKGEYEKAAQDWERVLLIDPTNERATASLREAKRRQPETERPRRTVVAGGVLTGESPPILGLEEAAPETVVTTTESERGTDSTTATAGGRPLVRGLEDGTVSKVHQPDESDISRMKRIGEKLEAIVAVDFPEGTDIRKVLAFLRDFIDVDIVLDERVMIPSDLRPPPSGERARRELGLEQVVKPNIESSVRRVYLKGITVKDTLKAILSQMGLSYKVQPEFIWVSRPDILRRESFEPLETRRYTLDSSVSRDEIMPTLETLPDVIEPYTERVLSYVEFDPTTNTVTIHNTPSNFEVIEGMLLRLAPPLVSAPPKPRPPGRGDEAMSRIGKTEKKLRETVFALDLDEGTDIRAVLTSLAESLQINIVLDERVMVDSPLEFPDELREPTIEPGIEEVHLEATRADEALKAILEPMGLDYKVQPEFIWVSRPDILRRESFEPLETRYYMLQHAYPAKRIIAKLLDEIPDIIEPYTDQTLSYMDFSPTTRLLIIHNTPSNLEMIEKIIEDHAPALE